MKTELINEILTSATTSGVGIPTLDGVSFKQRSLGFRIRGLTDSTVELQVSLDKGSTWQASDIYTTDIIKGVFHISPQATYRFEVTVYGVAGDSVEVLLLN